MLAESYSLRDQIYSPSVPHFPLMGQGSKILFSARQAAKMEKTRVYVSAGHAGLLARLYVSLTSSAVIRSSHLMFLAASQLALLDVTVTGYLGVCIFLYIEY